MLEESQDMLLLIQHALKEKRDLTLDEMAYFDKIHDRVQRQIDQKKLESINGNVKEAILDALRE
jgi:hypothetical protein